MKIAILGWGSLVWDVGTLKDHLENDGNFEQGGPELPIEFSRISVDGRLTLVIDKKNGAPVLTRVAISKQSDLKEAVKDLWIREGRLNDSSDVRSDAWGKNKEDGRIGYTDRDGKNASVNDLPKDKLTPDHQLAHEHIIGWLPKSNFDAVVWTALASNYKEKIGRDFSVEDAVKYLEDLPEKPTEPRMASRKDALDYIRRAPVITPLRIRLKDLLDGKRAEATATQNTETQSVPGTETQARPTTEPAQAQSETFTSAETEELKTQLEEERRRAAYWGGVNCTWDLTFKVVLLILGVVSATVAGLIATIWKPGSPPHWATIINIVVGVLITALAGFATAQVNFSARTEIYRKKETALRIMIDALKYLNPEKAVFLKTLQEIYSWNDSTPATVEIPKLVFSGLDDERHNDSGK